MTGADGKAFAIIGGGTMGETFARAMIANDLAAADAIIVSDISEARRAKLHTELGVQITDDVGGAAAAAPLVLLAVKPQDFAAVSGSLQGMLLPEQLILSIIAGVPIHTLQDGLGHRPVVRAMPNTPAQISRGLTVWTAPEDVSVAQRTQVGLLLATLGLEIYVPDENHIDMATAVSASGPGFIFLFLEALIAGAVHIGMRRELASELVYQTVLGSTAYAKESGLHPAVLRDMVTSPGGTTAEGLRALEQQGVRAGTMEAVITAYRRTLELGES